MTAPWWGMVAGSLLLADGGLALGSRWSPSTLALVHAFTLGLLGNVMFGSLLQFLPAAAGVRIPYGHRATYLLHGLLNLGAGLLLLGLRFGFKPMLASAGVALGAAFVLLAWMVLPGLVRATGQRLLHTGIGFAVTAALVTAALGISLLGSTVGYRGLPRLSWVDVHASWGVLGWVLGLLSSVAAVTMPMFQGTPTPSVRFQSRWLLALALVLLAGSVQRAATGSADLLQWGSAGCVVVWSLVLLNLQLRAVYLRNRPLTWLWRSGLLALLAAALVLASGGARMLAGTLAIAIGLPLMVVGMQLEIVAFLGWIDLHRRCGRGVRVPGVQALLPGADKQQVLAWLLAAAMALLAAVQWPGDLLARMAGALVAAAYLVLWLKLRGVSRRGREFVSSLPSATEDVPQ